MAFARAYSMARARVQLSAMAKADPDPKPPDVDTPCQFRSETLMVKRHTGRWMTGITDENQLVPRN